jgi:hypothetical protein
MSPWGALLRVYGWLLRGYPADFRNRFEQEMLLDLRIGYDAAETIASRVCFVAHLLEDLVMSMPAEWLRRDRIRVIALAAFAHLTLWLTAVAISRWQWPDGPSAMYVVAQFAGVALICISGVAARQHSSHERTLSLQRRACTRML